MASKKATTTTQPVKTKPRALKKQELIENKDLPVVEPLKVKKTTKKPKEDPITLPSAPPNTPIEKPKRKSNIEAGSEEAKAWSERMKQAREKKKAERLAQTTPVATN